MTENKEKLAHASQHTTTNTQQATSNKRQPTNPKQHTTNKTNEQQT